MAKLRVVVTRTANQAQTFCQKLTTAGFLPITFPSIQLQPLPTAPLAAALNKLETFDWLIFTSGNAVDFFFNAAACPDFARSTSLKIAAIGSATAQKLAERNLTIDFIPNEFVGAALAAGLGNLAQQTILLPRAKQGRPDITNLLQAAGAQVTEVPLYDTVTAVPSPTALEQLADGFEAITFTSPSSVRNFMKIMTNRPNWFKQTVKPWLETAVIICIGPITVAAARNLGLSVTLMPSEYTIDGMVQELTNYLFGQGQAPLAPGNKKESKIEEE